MARAYCTKCGKSFHWYGGKGRKVSEAESPCCHVPGRGRKSLKSHVTQRHVSVRTDVWWDGDYLTTGGSLWIPTDEIVDMNRKMKRANPQGHVLPSWIADERMLINEQDYQRLLAIRPGEVVDAQGV